VQSQKQSRVRWLLLALVYITCLVAYLDRVNLSIAGPDIMKEFGFDKVQLGMTMSAFFLAYTMMQIPGGLMSEKWGLRFTGSLAMFFWSLFTILTPMANLVLEKVRCFPTMVRFWRSGLVRKKKQYLVL